MSGAWSHKQLKFVARRVKSNGWMSLHRRQALPLLMAPVPAPLQTQLHHTCYSSPSLSPLLANGLPAATAFCHAACALRSVKHSRLALLLLLGAALVR